MAKEDIVPYQHNLTLKKAFKSLGLDISQVMEFSPYELDIENRRLESLLAFVLCYQKYGSRKTMELVEGGCLFPPIHPGISPESDWQRFELWLQGKPVRMKLADQLPTPLLIKSSAELPDEALIPEIERLEEALVEAGFGVSLHDGVPPRLIYDYLVQTLGETFELGCSGFWHLDGCDGYCPGCFQRIWCEIGDHSCWHEDEKAGKMSLIEALNPFVCASPQSLKILQKFQAEEDEREAQYEAENPESSLGGSSLDEDWKAKLN